MSLRRLNGYGGYMCTNIMALTCSRSLRQSRDLVTGSCSDELKFNLFFVSQMCDKKNSVLFTDTECLILSPSFKLLDETQVVLKAPRKDDVYSLDLKNIVPSK
ncbi:hypothetical protein Tco_0233986, partial [Tanacetum coccineum]